MLTSEQIRLILDKIGRKVVVPESDGFPYEIVTRRTSGYSADPKIMAVQAALSIMLEAASKDEDRKRGGLVVHGFNTFEWDRENGWAGWFVRCTDCLATMDFPAAHTSRHTGAECKKGQGTGPPVWHAWMVRHNAHGPSLDTLMLLPAGDTPETSQEWIRAPWLDGAA